jgi:hypothetical protein
VDFLVAGELCSYTFGCGTVGRPQGRLSGNKIAKMNIISIGLFYDIAGVIVLGIGVAFNAKANILGQSSSGTWRGNPDTLEALCKQQTDTFYGLILLVLGFAFQLAGSLAPQEETLTVKDENTILLATLAGLILLLWLVMRRITHELSIWG